MNRRKARENAFIALFELGFGGEAGHIIEYGRAEGGEYALDEFGEDILRLYEAHEDEVNETINTRLRGWKADRVPRVCRAVLRLATTEMVYAAPDMDSVVINEAVELTKKYGDEQDYQFVNGVLGAISRDKAAPAGEA